MKCTYRKSHSTTFEISADEIRDLILRAIGHYKSSPVPFVHFDVSSGGMLTGATVEVEGGTEPMISEITL